MSKLMKPEGKWRCRACGRIWDGSQLYEKLGYTNPRWWTCHDLFCGGTCDRIRETTLAQEEET